MESGYFSEVRRWLSGLIERGKRAFRRRPSPPPVPGRPVPKQPVPKQPAPVPPPPIPKGKSIVLFSDGTGNSSAKLFKTNVWRMYEAVELDNSAAGREQIVHYDEGVGNSRIRPLAALGAVFGIGLKTNVLDLYRFACRNYQPGDEIYAFGFSRGAFTVRMLIA
jgi:hypothetical protein